MKTRSLVLGLSALSAASVVLADVSVSGVIRIGDAPPPPTIVVEAAQPGPPPWAPAHGRRAKYVYYYYPGCDVYYRPADRMWVYLEGSRWSVAASLPSSIRIDLRRSISLEMDTDRPYVHHAKVRAFYPASVVAKADRGHSAGEARGLGESRAQREPNGPPDEGKGHGKKGKGGKAGKGRD